VLRHLRVQESRWVGGRLAGVRFTGLECRDTEFVQCDLSGTVLDGAQLTDVRITDSAADLLSLRMVRGRFLLVENSGLHAADLYEFDGEHCAFLGCDLGEASVQAARLQETDLHGCTVDDLRGALSLRGARISPDQIVPLAAVLLDELGIQVTEQPPSSR
jgi:uncharacterized protein YjbI with pentapeptide repeats